MICTWNVRGAGKKGFARLINDMKDYHNIDIFVILEPRISGKRATSIISKLGFASSFIVEADGFSGGFWLLWKPTRVSVGVVASSRQSITALVSENAKVFILTIVYASPNVMFRRSIWGYLHKIRKCFKGPWLVAGDFNEIVSLSEKRGGRSNFSKSGFLEWINNNGLIDMGFIGQKFTWMAKRGVGNEI
ncbi:hypothetical protein ACOSQ3_016445 [Xanthoceras sorbifolium]